MTHDDPLESLRHQLGDHFKARRGPTGLTPDCADPVVLARLADGLLAGEARAAVLAHLAGCARCRSDLAEVTRALRDPGVSRAIRGGGVRRQLLRIAVPLAAAAAFLLVFRPTVPDGAPDAFREPGVMTARAPELRAPIGPVAEARILSWSPIQGADRYRVTLFDGDRVAFDGEVRDTAVTLPDSVALRPGSTYLWKVAARTSFDRWVSSDLVRFSVVEARP